MKLEDLISAKMLVTWPKSWEIFEESCIYSLKNKLDFVKGVLLHEERMISYEEQPSIIEQLFSYLNTLGYKNMSARNGTFCTKEGFKNGLVFVVFLSKSTQEQLNKESEKWNTWASHKGSVMAGVKPLRPMFEQIEYLNIYKPTLL